MGSPTAQVPCPNQLARPRRISATGAVEERSQILVPPAYYRLGIIEEPWGRNPERVTIGVEEA
jgi:hypothetical protein